MRALRCRLARALALAAALAAAASLTTADGATTKPTAGPWKVVALFRSTSDGGFTVTKSGSVRGIRVVPSTGASTGCGTSAVTVPGSFKLRTATRGGFTSWIIGRAAPKESDGVKTIPVTVVREGQRVKGAVKLIFAYDSRRKGSGELSFPGCTVAFDLRSKR